MIIAALALGCRPEPTAAPPAQSDPTLSSPTGAEEWVDPFAPQPDQSEGLTNVSDDLDALLEHGALNGACDAWEANPGDRRLELLCGKSMFFYEGFGTLGIPTVLIDTLPELFPDELGPAFSRLGLVPHPTEPHGRPIGFGVGAPLGGNETLAMTCASCHFGPLGDGRYAVGAPNHGYAYGEHMLSILLIPAAASPLFRESDHDPEAIAAVRDVLDRLSDDPGVAIQLGLALLPLLGVEVATVAVEQEGEYASWPPGTMDFVIDPLPIDDGVHTVSKISALWGIPSDAEVESAHMEHAMLAWAGSAHSLDQFLQGFVQLGGGDVAAWPPERLAPLRSYIESLRAPEPLEPPDVDAVSRGEAVFRSAGCVECHAGPRGSGARIYTYDEIGTDAAMEAWADPDLDGEPCCGIGDTDTVLTHGIKSPRLTGSAYFGRFLHNGSLGTLEEVLCLSPRPDDRGEPWSDAGHTYGCDLPDDERAALAVYLRAH
ncbi:MAG: hypothetical protein ABMA64_09470 [Myxococcota bacterium]